MLRMLGLHIYCSGFVFIARALYVLFREWIVQIISPTLRINRFHKMTGEVLNPIHYLLFYTELNHYTTNNYCVSFSNRLFPIRTSLITDLEQEAFELHDEWLKMNDFLEDIQSFRK